MKTELDDFGTPFHANVNGHANGHAPRPVGFARPLPTNNPTNNHNGGHYPRPHIAPAQNPPAQNPPAQANTDMAAIMDDGGHRATLKQTDIVAFNQTSEQAFLRLAWMLIDEEGGSVKLSVLLQEAAFELNLSEKTIRRYVFKHTARRASLAVHADGSLYRKC